MGKYREYIHSDAFAADMRQLVTESIPALAKEVADQGETVRAKATALSSDGRMGALWVYVSLAAMLAVLGFVARRLQLGKGSAAVSRYLVLEEAEVGRREGGREEWRQEQAAAEDKRSEALREAARLSARRRYHMWRSCE